MNALKSITIIFATIFFLSCTNNEPVVHTTIAGVWRCTEITNHTSSQSYLLDIQRSVSDTTMYIVSNFHNTGDNEFVKLKLTSTKLQLAEQPSANISIKNFSGTVESLKLIQLQYTVSDVKYDSSVTATYSRN
jgi:hypothetical protein